MGLKWSAVSNEISRKTAACYYNYTHRIDCLGMPYGRCRYMLPVICFYEIFAEIKPRQFFRRPCNLVQMLNTAYRVLAHSGLAREHHRIHLFVYRVCNVCYLGPCGYGVFDHRFKQVGCHDYPLSLLMTLSYNRTLNVRQFFDVDLNPQIAPGYHDRIRYIYNLFYVIHSLTVFDFRYDLYLVYLCVQKLL